ncbi:MAG: bifunctional serine/threonine-protein kinase/formylglycine-generating enzyme family protein [Planctomycetia bacterium]|nr:bifunctional serine/threonine-protein kinase/formylglycine-generating enzyme family protein [Planctomycetia bacterium]
MANVGELEQLSDAESVDLNSRVARFQAAWKPDGSAAVESFLPPSGSRHRFHVLVQLIETDMQRRVQAGLPIRVEMYLDRFREDFPTDTVPVSLIAAEYQLRSRFADKPPLDEYRWRFQRQYDLLLKRLELGLLAPSGLEPVTQPTAGFANDSSQVPGGKTSDPANQPTRATGVVPGAGGDGRAGAVIHPPGARVLSGGFSASAGPIDINVANLARQAVPYDVLPTDSPYRLVRKLGSGAYGEVFEALAPGDVKVAIKRITRPVEHSASQSELEALEAIKELSHPFLLKTHAYWVFDNRLVMVMDLADCSLTDRIVHYKHLGLPGVPPEELIPFFEQAAKALDYLHEKNVSHRDVKPENLLVLGGYAKVADFGLARWHEHTMTVVNQEVGTPSYMAPEVWKRKVSLHSDQYSFAATYFMARLGRRLFEAQSIFEQAHQHVNDTPNLDPLPAAEQKVLLRALAKNPDDRYPSCAEFVEALREAVFPPPPPLPLAEPVTRRGEGILRILAIALACALAVGLVNWAMNRDDPPPPKEEKVKKNGEQPPEKKFWCPPGWLPVNKNEIERGSVSSDREYYRKLTREVDGEKLVAILVPQTRPTDPPPFYMLQNKITNRVFQHVWDTDIKDQPDKERFPGKWRTKVDYLLDKKQTAKDYPDNPVLGVTVPEAMIVAEKLGGLIPTHRQWKKATGAMGDGNGEGPAGPPLPEFSGLEGQKLYDAQRKELERRNLALGLLGGPWPVSKLTTDKSYLGIYQLISNGREWIDNEEGGKRRDLATNAAGATPGYYVGKGPGARTVLMWKDITLEPEQTTQWTEWEVLAGFRIVLEP